MLKLTDRAVIALTGPEARTFLNGLVTNDVTRVTPDTPAYAALLTPQGKVLFDFLVHAAGDDLFLDCATSSREALLKRLSMYRLRAKVEIAPRDDLAVVTQGPADPRHAGLGGRSVVPVAAQAADAAYLETRLALGIPEGGDFAGQFAMDAGLDELHAISFTKGCYVGQELTARMKHRGTDRKRLLVVTAQDGSLPAPGTVVATGDTSLGEITAVYGARGFAAIRLDRLADSHGPFLAGDVPVALTKQDWLSA